MLQIFCKNNDFWHTEGKANRKILTGVVGFVD